MLKCKMIYNKGPLPVKYSFSRALAVPVIQEAYGLQA